MIVEWGALEVLGQVCDGIGGSFEVISASKSEVVVCCVGGAMGGG